MGTPIKSIQKELNRIQKELEQTIDQIVVLTIASDGKVEKMNNLWDINGTGSFDPNCPEDFMTPVNQSKKVTWIGIPDKDTHTIIIENIAIKPTSGDDVLKQKAYTRKGGNYFVVGKVKDKVVSKVKDKGDNPVFEDYSITFSVHDPSNGNSIWYTIDPKISPHD